jgi:Chaperone of endosialidase
MNLPKLLLYPLGFLVLSSGIVWAAQLTMSTYYPSPSGNYKNLNVANNFGIGTTSPSTSFEVRGSGSGVAPATSGTTDSTMIFRASRGTVGVDIGILDNGTGYLQNRDVSNFANNFNFLLEPNGGNVGIGNTNPTYPLTVKNVVALGAALNNTTPLLTLQNTNSNFNVLNFSQIRTAAGASWATATTRIQNITDVSLQSYMDFNPVNGTNAIAFGNNGAEYMRIASGGNIGIGSVSPSAKLDVFNSWITPQSAIQTDTNATAGITWYTAAPTSYGIFRTAGAWTASTYQQLKLSFATGIIIDGGSAYTKSGTVLQPNGGNVGIGPKATPSGQLDISHNPGNGFPDGIVIGQLDGDNTESIQTYIDTGAGGGYGIWGYASNCCHALLIQPHGGLVGIGVISPDQALEVVGNIHATSTVYADSDARLKQNILPLAGTLSKLDQLRGVSFEWNHLSTSMGHKEGEKGIGIIAQELEKVYPELVAVPKSQGHKYLSIDYGKFTAVLLQSVKELKSQINTMQDQVNVLQRKVKTLEKQK